MARDIAFVADKDTPEDGLTPGEPVPLPDGPRSEGSEAARAQPTGKTAENTARNQASEPQEPAAGPSPAPAALEAAAEKPPETDAPEPRPETPDSAQAQPVESKPQPAEEADWGFTSAAEDLFRPPELHSDDPHLITTGRRLKSSSGGTRAEPATEPQIEPATTSKEVWKRRILIGLRYAAYAAAIYLALILLLIVLFRFVNPPGSMLMLSKRLGGTAIARTWVPFEAISPALVRAVIVSEDSRFCEHSGIDLQAMRLALEEAGNGTPRGASTISMQVTKNLFLWNAKSYLRKVVEIPLTLIMEIVWPKERIVEVYLNIAEWGPGVFGAEAAARHHFGKSASKLSGREAALLAAALPNPHVRVAGKPGPRTSRMARVIQTRVRAFGSVAQCVVARGRSSTSTASSDAGTGSGSETPVRKSSSRRTEAQNAPNKTRPDDWGTTLRFGP